MAFKDYYRILGIKPDSVMKEIKDAYRRKASDFHPDKHPEKEPDPRDFHEICEAYEVLGTPETRREYDRKYKENELEAFNRTSPDTGSRRMSQSSGFGQLFDDLFDQFFHGSPVNMQKKKRYGNDRDNIHYDDLTSGGSD